MESVSWLSIPSDILEGVIVLWKVIVKWWNDVLVKLLVTWPYHNTDLEIVSSDLIYNVVYGKVSLPPVT